MRREAGGCGWMRREAGGCDGKRVDAEGSGRSAARYSPSTKDSTASFFVSYPSALGDC